nr:hypothetical protein [Phytoactinopolyspora alkaliphila]
MVGDTVRDSLSWCTPRETVQRARSSTRKSKANRNSFHAIMNTYRAVATMPGMAIGMTTLRMVCVRVQPSIIAASSTERGTAMK